MWGSSWDGGATGSETAPSRRNGPGCVVSPVVGCWLFLYPTAHGFSHTCLSSLLWVPDLLLVELLIKGRVG